MITKRFNTELPKNMSPFMFIEDMCEVKTKYAGKLAIISYGALEYKGRYAPEFGGVALVRMDPDVVVCVKYIPFGPNSRKTEFERAVKYLKAHTDLDPNTYLSTWYYAFKYAVPTIMNQNKKDYMERRKNLETPEEIMNSIRDKYNKEERKFLNIFKRKQTEEKEKKAEAPQKEEPTDKVIPLDIEWNEDQYKKLDENNNDPAENWKKNNNTADGEDLIPLD